MTSTSTSTNTYYRSNASQLWMILKYLLLISLYLSSHLHISDAITQLHECNEFTFPCADNSKCISKGFVCDGENDCGDFSDEKNCNGTDTIHKTDQDLNEKDKDVCNADSFYCLDGLCIPNHWVCDGNADCLDESDETSGCNNTVSCDDGFRCKSRTCIPMEWRCDGSNDCGDNSDEEDCSYYDVSACNVNNKQFLCSNRRRCIKLDEVCDGIPHCPDQSDESGECLKPLNCQPNCTNGHQCIKTPLKSLCMCPSGHMDQGGLCRDIDECTEFGACDQGCENTIGSFKCSCINGYKLLSDRKTCKADGGEGLLLFSSEREIRAFFLDSKIYYPISKVNGHANGIAYDGHHVYWSNVGEDMEAIVRAKEDGSDAEVLVDSGLGTPENLALDWITANIYFTDSQMQHIGVCTKNGVHCTILHKDGLDNPRAIALYPERGLLFWSDWGDNVRSIMRSGMDGSNRVAFVDTDLFWPNGITIDFGTDRLYWADAKKKRIESILLDGNDRRIIVSEPVDNPFSMAVFENKLYWSDWKGNQILTCNKFNGKNHTALIKKHNSQIYNLYIFHSSVQSSSINNPCLSKGCSHICLLKPSITGMDKTVCACPQDMELSPNGLNCLPKENIDAIYVAAGNVLTEIKYDKIGKRRYEQYNLEGINVLGDMTYNAYEDSIIFSDLYRQQITSFNRKTKQHNVILEATESLVSKMDYDPIANNLYWIDGKTRSLNVMNLQTMHKVVLINNFGGDMPMDIELVPELGIMFVSLFNQKGRSHIDRYWMDGSSRFHFIEKDLIGPMITLKFDYDLHRLFYADQGTGAIVSVSPDVLDKHFFREHLPGPVGLTMHGNYIFWVNYGSDKVNWANKYQTTILDTRASINRKGVDIMKLMSLEKFDIPNNTTCHVNSGGCSHLCLLKDKKQVCACPAGTSLDKSGLTCVSRVECHEDQFTCSSGECISKDLVCNRVQDCQTGDDEANCVFTTHAPRISSKPTCPLDYFFCLDNTGCLPLNQVCDSINDCPDASDEAHCGLKRKCSEVEFNCGSGECVPSSWRCDDRIDCKDSSDEVNCKSNTCDPLTQFRCESGNCIPSTWECDHEFDCPDASDEHVHCKQEVLCKERMFTCINHKCVDEKLKCNGDDDCGDNSDEIDCKTEMPLDLDVSSDWEPGHRNIRMCNTTHFTCSGHNHLCIPLSARCDGHTDCTYGEDESECAECLYGYFECKDIKECIPEVWVCDGVSDCQDNTDENHTLCLLQGAKAYKDQNETVPCVGLECKDSKRCIPFSKVCDKVQDCDDNSDEMGLCGVGCDVAGCDQVCQENPSGAQCDCYDGYELNTDGRTCRDINECANPSTCSQTCHNTVGSYFCTCLSNYYQLRDDRRRCKATGKDMELVYLTEKDIRLTTETFSSVQVLYSFKGLVIIEGMDVNVDRNLLYWTSKNDGAISILPMDDPSKIAVSKGFDQPSSLAVEWITGNVYFVVGSNRITLCDSMVRVCSQIYSAFNDVKIKAIAVDSLRGFLYWSESIEALGHSTTKLMKSLLSGKAVELVMRETTSIPTVSDLAFDVVSKWLFYSDPSTRNVGRVNHNGTKMEVLFTTNELPVCLGLFEDHIYISSKNVKKGWQSKAGKQGVIKKCGVRSDSFGECSYIRLLPAGSDDSVRRLRVSHPSLQIKGPNFCEEVKCQGICVNSGTKGVCLCGEGEFAPPDGTCSNMKTVMGSSESEEEDSSNYIFVLTCLLLTLLTIGGVVFAARNNQLPVPSDLYRRARRKMQSISLFRFKKFDNKSFQFGNLRSELTEELIQEQPEYNNPLIRTF